MSRSNTHYFNLCGPVNEDGLCKWHVRKYWRGIKKKCIYPNEFWTRRGLVVRKQRFVRGWKTWSWGPPADMKRVWCRQVRAKYSAAMALHPDDPQLPDLRKWLAGKYEYWS